VERSELKILVFQHHPAEHVGRFAKLMEADGIYRHVVQLDRGDEIPSLDDFDGLWVFGGQMQVWEEAEHPWLLAEKAAIREAVGDRGMPYFGVCLGHQLLADALGGTVSRLAAPEVGNLNIALTPEGKESPLFEAIDAPLVFTQGHGAEVSRPPSDARVLASSPVCAVQSMQIGANAFSVQFHPELTPDMIVECLEIPEYKVEFDAMLGEEGTKDFLASSTELATRFDELTARLYMNWMAACFGENLSATSATKAG